MEHFRSNESPVSRDIFETEDEERLVAETRELLNSLDEEALRDIFERELSLSGVEYPDYVVRDKFIPFNHIHIDGQYVGRTEGSFGSASGLTLNAKPIQESARASTLFIRSDLVKKISNLHDQWMAVVDAEKEVLPGMGPIRGLLKMKSTSKELAKIDGVIKRLKESRVMNNDLMGTICFKIETVHTTVHEELHALSNSDNWQIENSGGVEQGSVSLYRLASGLKENVLMMKHEPWQVNPSVKEHYCRFTALNEGVTELNALRLSHEYLAQALPKEVLGSDIQVFYNLVEVKSYNRERWVAEQLVTLFSVIAEVPNHVIERSLFRAYLNGEDFLPEELIAAVRHDVPELSKEHIEQMLLKLQIAIGADSFTNGADTDINRVFVEFADMLPPEKRDAVKDAFQELFYKYSFSKELQDGVVE